MTHSFLFYFILLIINILVILLSKVLSVLTLTYLWSSHLIFPIRFGYDCGVVHFRLLIEPI